MKNFFYTLYLGFLWIRDVALFGQWVKFWDWIKLAHSSSDEASSKRLYGGLLILSCITVFMLFCAGVFSIAAWTTMFAAWFIMLISGLGLISLAVLEKVTQIVADFKIAKIQELPKEVNQQANPKPEQK